MKQLSLEEKQTVQTQLQAYVSKYPSQNKAVNSLGLSTSTVSAILNGKFDNISDEMFLRIRSLVPRSIRRSGPSAKRPPTGSCRFCSPTRRRIRTSRG